MASEVRTGQFYAPWPVLDGKSLNLQWGEIRRNQAESKAVIRGSFQDIESGADSLNALRALIGLAFGEQGFDNKYRLIYNKTTFEFCAQKNDGTEAVPVWEDVWCIRFSDGQFQVTSKGGIQSNAGFYGPLPHDLLAIGEILKSGALGGTQFVNPNELYFNTNTGFYLTSVTSGPRAGKPIVNFAFPFGKSKTFAKSGKVWQVAHNFNTKPVLVQVMNDGDVVVIPDKIDVSDPNNAWFYFDRVTSGNALIATGGTGAVELIPALGVTDGTNAYTNVEDLNFSGDGFYVSSDLAGSPVVNLKHLGEEGNDLVISSSEGGEIHLKPSAGNRHVVIDAPDGLTDLLFASGGTKRWRISDDSTAAAVGILAIGSGVSNANVVQLERDPPRMTVGISSGPATATLDVGGHGRFSEQLEATALYLQPGSGGGMWKSGDDVVVGSKDGAVLIPSNFRVTGDARFEDKVVAEAFYTIDGGEVGSGSSLEVTDGSNIYLDTSKLNVNDDTFYLSSDLSGNPVLNLQTLGAATDHGTLSGLNDDDHMHYSLVDGTRSFTGDVTIDSTSPTLVVGDASVTGTAQVTVAAPRTTSQVRVNLVDTETDEDWSLESTTGNVFQIQSFKDANTQPFKISPSSATDAIVITGRRVGVLTSTPEDELHVAGRGRFDDQVRAEAFYLESGGNWGDTELLVEHASSAAEVTLNAASSGSARVNLQEAGVRQWRMEHNSSNGFFQIASLNNNGAAFKIGADATAGITITELGRVGVQQDNPTATLHVAGHGRFDEQLEATAFYLQPGSGGGMWKSGDDVVVGSSDRSVILESAFNDAATPAVSLSFDTGTLTNPTPTVVALDWSPTFDTSNAAAVNTYFTQTVPAITVATDDLLYRGHRVAGLFTQAISASGGGSLRGFSCEYEQTASGISFVPELSVAFSDETTLKAQALGNLTQALGKRSFESSPILFADGTADRVDSGFMTGLRFNPRYRTQGLGSIVDFGDMVGVQIQAPTQSVAHVGSAIATSYVGVDVEDLTSVVTVSKITALQSAIPAGATNFFLENTGGAKSDFGGGFIEAGKALFNDQVTAEAFYLIDGGEFSDNTLDAEAVRFTDIGGLTSTAPVINIGLGANATIKVGTSSASAVSIGGSSGSVSLFTDVINMGLIDAQVAFNETRISLRDSRFLDRAYFEDQVVAEAFYLIDGGNWIPTELLVKSGTAAANTVAVDASASQFSQLTLRDQGADAWSIRKDTGNNLDFVNPSGVPFTINDAAPAGVFRISAAGQVGIQASSPMDLLHVGGRGRFDDRVLAEAFYLGPDGGGNMWTDASGNLAIEAVHGGEVHLGSRDIANDVVIARDDGILAQLDLKGYSGFFRAGVSFWTADTERWQIRVDQNAILYLKDVQTNTSPWIFEPGAPDFTFHMRGDGHIGFGTDEPQAKVHVIGDFKADDRILSEAFYVIDGGEISANSLSVPNASSIINLGGTGSSIGFFGTAPAAKPDVSGSRAGNAALADLLTELANLGLITDSSS